MGKVKGIDIKNRTNYFYNDLINIEDFYPNLLKLDKRSFENISISYIGYVTKKEEYKLNSVNPLYLLVHRIEGFIEENEGSKYLNITSADNNNEVLKNMKKSGVGSKLVLKK